MANNSRAAAKTDVNKDVIIFSTPSNGQNTPSMVFKADLNNLNNE